MATKVKETPILTGKYARQFDQDVKANELNKVSSEAYKKAMKSYRRFKVIEPAEID